MTRVSGGITAPKGFTASGLFAGIKRSRKPDVALVVSKRPAAAAGVFTRNLVQAAPVLLTKAHLKAGRAQAILVNSGCANCMTGTPGLRDAERLGRAAAGVLGIPASSILHASTGLIGKRLPADKIEAALPRLARRLSREHHEAAAQAILTTDLRPKEAAVEAVIGGIRVRVGGMAKGAGMIAPSMATMLCFMTTDAAVAAPALRRLLQQAAEGTFNRITVDGDMSTNDCVLALANGASGARITGPGLRVLGGLIHDVMERLARAIVEDGEGAAKIMELDVRGAKTAAQALSCARTIACSPLVKTMLAGSDPNVGRLAAAAGASSARFNPDKLEIFIEGVRLVRRGAALPVPSAVLRRLLSRPVVHARVELHAGSASERMLTCDLTEEYIRINAGYAT